MTRPDLFDAAEAMRVAEEMAEDVIGNRATCLCESCISRRVRLKSNARSAATQLRAAIAEVESVRTINELLTIDLRNARSAAGVWSEAIWRAELGNLSAEVERLRGLCREALAGWSSVLDEFHIGDPEAELQPDREHVAAINAALEKKETP